MDDMDKMTQFFRKVMGFQGIPTSRLAKFKGTPRKPGDPSLLEWLGEFEAAIESYDLSDKEKAKAIVDHLIGAAKEEAMCLPEDKRNKYSEVKDALKLCFGNEESMKSLSSAFYNSNQGEKETLSDFSRSLLRLYGRMEAAALTQQDRDALRQLRDRALRDQFARGAREAWVRRELRRIDLATTDAVNGSPFDTMRKEALLLFNESEPVRASIRSVHFKDHHDGEPEQSTLLKEVMELRAEVSSLKSVVSEVGELRAALKELLDRKTELADMECYSCGRKGHRSRNCPQRNGRRRGYQQQPPRQWASQPPRQPWAPATTQGANYYADVSLVQQPQPPRQPWLQPNGQDIPPVVQQTQPPRQPWAQTSIQSPSFSPEGPVVQPTQSVVSVASSVVPTQDIQQENF